MLYDISNKFPNTIHPVRRWLITIKSIAIMALLGLLPACSKLIQINPPTSTITTAQAFADSADADASILGMYASIATTQSNIYIGSGALTIYTGLSSDELVNYATDINVNQIYDNLLLQTNVLLDPYYWTPAYSSIYMANSCIESITASTGISPATKAQLIGEAKFCRALLYFYLINLFGDVPFVTSSNYATNSLLPRTPTTNIYQSLISDLQEAKLYLPIDYSLTNGQRVRATKWAAQALLARIFLYRGDYPNAANEADSIISFSHMFSLSSTPNDVFLTASNETILQWSLNTSVYPFNATPEGQEIIPYAGSYPNFYISPELLNAFEPGDIRRLDWIDSTTYLGTTYYFPYKYKIGSQQAQAGGPATESYTVLRLAEQYLIRAEAEANGALGGLSSAISDLNYIRNRAGLLNLPATLDKTQTMNAIMQERRIELFAEWGHRWLDLKRTGAVDSIMSNITPQKNGGTSWNSDQALYPIPLSELRLNPNLKQNAGY